MKCELCNEEMIRSPYRKTMICPKLTPNNGVDLNETMSSGLLYSFAALEEIESLKYHSHFVNYNDEPHFFKGFYIENTNINFYKNGIISVFNVPEKFSFEITSDLMDCHPSNYINIIRNFNIIK